MFTKAVMSVACFEVLPNFALTYDAIGESVLSSDVAFLVNRFCRISTANENWDVVVAITLLLSLICVIRLLYSVSLHSGVTST